MDWTDLAEDRDKWRAFVKAAISLVFHNMQGIPRLLGEVLNSQKGLCPMESVDCKPAYSYVITMWRFPFSVVEYGEVRPLYAIMSYKGVEIELHSFLISKVNGGE